MVAMVSSIQLPLSSNSALIYKETNLNLWKLLHSESPCAIFKTLKQKWKQVPVPIYIYKTYFRIFSVSFAMRKRSNMSHIHWPFRNWLCFILFLLADWLLVVFIQGLWVLGQSFSEGIFQEFLYSTFSARNTKRSRYFSKNFELPDYGWVSAERKPNPNLL